MLKRIAKNFLTGALALAFSVAGSAMAFSTPALAAVPVPTPALPAPTPTPPPLPHSVTIEQDMAMISTSMLYVWQGREQRVFDDVIDQIFFNQFGENFEFLRERSTNVNRRATYGNLHLEVLYSVAIAGNSHPRIIMDRATGETTEDWTNATAEIEVITFFSLEDRSATISFTPDITLNSVNDWAFVVDLPPLWTSPSRLLHIDEDAGRAYFSIQHTGSIAAPSRSVNIDFTFNHIVGGFTVENETLTAIDPASILAGHNAAVNRRERLPHEWFRGIFHTPQDVIRSIQATAIEISGFAPYSYSYSEPQDRSELIEVLPIILPPPPPIFDFLQPQGYIYITERGQLNIPLHGSTYLTNIALRGNYLHVQTREHVDFYIDFADFTRVLDVESIRLVDTRIVAPYFGHILDATPESIAALEELMEANMVYIGNFVHFDSIDISVVCMNTLRPIDDMRYT